MGNPLYLAMTAAEFANCKQLPEKIAWMACHFSPYGAGLSNMPQALPQGSILILNDRIEPTCHDADLVAAQAIEIAERFSCSGILLDFQRPGSALTQRIAAAVAAASPCPIAVSHHYAKELSCAVFLPPPPLRCDADKYFAPWQGRKIWLEAYDQWETVTVTADRVTVSEEPPPDCPPLSYYDETLRCHYRIDTFDDRAIFTLHRGLDELRSLPCPIAKYFTLWQECSRKDV